MTKQDAVIFDVDGTVALRDKGPRGRSPYDMSRVIEDLPNVPVLKVAKLLAVNGPLGDVVIVFVSGREESARKQTALWLDMHFGHDYYLYMREVSDMRPDETIKLEILRGLQEQFTVIATFDDRNTVVDMWRANGITCFQVCSREEGGF